MTNTTTQQKRWYTSLWFIAAASAVAVFVINWPSFILYIISPFIQGWDGAGHASIGQYYAEHIFPSTWGWVTNWYTGMPFPQFYPPLFYFLLALIYHVIPAVSYTTVFKVFVIALQLLVPVVSVYFVGFRTPHRGPPVLAGILSVILCSSIFPEMGNSGVNVASTIHVGMVTQLLGYVLLVCWLHFFLQIEKSRKAQLFAGVFLFFTFLSNAHVNIVAGFLFAIIYLVSLCGVMRKEKGWTRARFIAMGKHFQIYFLSGFLPLIATSFWLIPLSGLYTYFTTIPVFFPPTVLQAFTAFPLIPAVLIAGTVIGIWKKNIGLGAVSLAGFVVFLFIFISPSILFNEIPAHLNRWFGIVSFLVPLVAGLSYAEVSALLEKRVYKFLLASVVVYVALVGSGPFSFIGIGGFYLSYKEENFMKIVEYVKEQKNLGIILNERAELADQQSMMVFDSVVGFVGEGALTHILRESSINSTYLTPIRNSLSHDQEGWGFRSYLVFDQDFIDQDIQQSLDRAEQVGVQSFLVRAKTTKEKLVSSGRVISVKDFGGWELYSFKKKTPRAATLSGEPVAMYAKLTFKERWIADYDWSRFQEELLFGNRKDITTYYPHDQFIDSSLITSSSSAAIISQYTYHDIRSALASILEYATDKKVVVVANTDPLFKEILDFTLTASTTKTAHNIKIIDSLYTTILDKNPLRPQLAQAFDFLHASSSPVVAPSISVTNTSVSQNKIHVELSATSTEPVPVIVKVSYFPAWKRVDGQDVYLVSPGFMLTNATSSFDLVFETPHSVYLGYLISFLTIISSVVWGVYRIRRT